jgi:N-acetylmuramoyl-L-alanine amidase
MTQKKIVVFSAFLAAAVVNAGSARALILLETQQTETPLAERPGHVPGIVAVAAPAGPVLILDPGHGGNDLGAVVGGRREKDIALSIAHRLKALLETRKAGDVRMTRESDDFVPLDQRIDDSKEWSGSVFVSLHLNQVPYKKLNGITVYAFGKNHYKRAEKARGRRKYAPLPPPPKEMAKASAALAESIVESLRHEGLRVEAPAKAGFYVLKNPGIPSVLIELGYLSNPQEAARLIDPTYQEKLAAAIASSLQSFTARLPTARR